MPLDESNSDHGAAGLSDPAKASARPQRSLLRWIGRKHGGFVAAIKLTVISYGFWSALVAAAYATWLAAGMGGPPDAGLIGFTATVAVALFIPTRIMLRRLDPDF